jgi:ubiquinone/menaquinone biosynthesis C-methylase UbiE
MPSAYEDYWNDVVAEKAKPYAVQSVDDPRLHNWLREDTKLEQSFLDGIGFLFAELKWKGGRVLDVGAGVCWTSATLSRHSQITSVRAFDYSRHRIEKYAPVVIQQFGGVRSKIELVVGDFWKIPDHDRFDLIVFCQALYMFPNAQEVLARCRRQLQKGGLVMVACEQIEPEFSKLEVGYWRNAFKRKVDNSGRYRMVQADYRRAFEKAGLQYHFQRLDYPLMPNLKRCLAGNHFGIKS